MECAVRSGGQIGGASRHWALGQPGGAKAARPVSEGSGGCPRAGVATHRDASFPGRHAQEPSLKRASRNGISAPWPWRGVGGEEDLWQGFSTRLEGDARSGDTPVTTEKPGTRSRSGGPCLRFVGRCPSTYWFRGTWQSGALALAMLYTGVSAGARFRLSRPEPMLQSGEIWFRRTTYVDQYQP